MTHLLLASSLPLFDKIQVIKSYHLLHVTSLVHYVSIITLVKFREYETKLLIFFFIIQMFLHLYRQYQNQFFIKKK
jgi:hypothetical protein